MHAQPTRRHVIALIAAILSVAVWCPRQTLAQGSASTVFVNEFASQLTGIVNGPQSAGQKRAALGPVIDSHVDVPKIARFCLGRFWAGATPAQQSDYVTLFHRVLLNNIRGHLGDYQGVSYSLRGETPQGASTLVGTVINRPNAPSVDVQWVVDSSGGAPKIVDVVAEGTSLRLTQRSDYASYLGQHGGSVAALITALQKQLDAAE